MAVTSMANSSVANFNKSNNVSNSKGALGAGGNHVGDANGYRYHVFTSSGTFTMKRSGVIEYLVIGGGGAGGQNTSRGGTGCGGGGAGGVLRGTTVLSTDSYTVTVGAGGNATEDQSVDGSDSSLGSIVAFGGGGGGSNETGADASSGASGGGGAVDSSNGDPGAAPLGAITLVATWEGAGEQGHQGGDGSGGGVKKAGGGGGAGSPGHFGEGDGTWAIRSGNNFGKRGYGGIGVRHDDFGADATTVAGVTIGDPYAYTPDGGGSDTAYYFGGGGGGGNDQDTNDQLGGPGGGGKGTLVAGVAATDGADFTGAGGGGGADGLAGGDGGSGIVIVRYAL